MSQGTQSGDVSLQDDETGVEPTPRRSFLKLLGGAALGALAAVAGGGLRRSDVQATHNAPTQEWLHSLNAGENRVNGVVITNQDPRSDGVWDPRHAILEVGRDFDSSQVFRAVRDEGDLSPAIRGIRGNAISDSYNHGAAVVGRHLGDGTAVLGNSDGGVGVHGEGASAGVQGDGDAIGVSGSGDVGVLGTGGQGDAAFPGASGIGLVGLGRINITLAESIHDTTFHYSFGDGDELITDPRNGGIGARVAGATGVEGIADDPDGFGVLGSNWSGGRGVVGYSLEGTGVTGVGSVGLHGIAIDENGNIVGQGVLGEGVTGIVGKSIDPGGVGVQGDSDEGVGVQGNSANSNGIRGNSTNGDGVHGNGRTGVRGKSEDVNGEGVRGENLHGDGVRGEGRTGVHGKSDEAQGKGVHGEAEDGNGVGVQGNNGQGDAVRGEGKTGVRGKSADASGFGVAGENDNGIGVEGRGKVGIRGVAAGHGGGVGNQSSSGSSAPSLLSTSAPATLLDTALPEYPVAIQGIAQGTNSIGIEARAESEGSTAMKVETTTRESVALEVKVPEGGTAIHIKGAACFDTVGMGMFAKNTQSVTVSDSRVTGDSFIYAMVTGDPKVGQGTDMVAIQWIDRHPGEGFTVHLNTSIKRETPFSYFVVEPCPPDDHAEA